MRRREVSFLASIVCLLALAACSPTPVPPQPRPVGRIAVAAFTAPQYNWELLAGYLPQEGKAVDPAVLAKLDDVLGRTLHEHHVSIASGPTETRQCQEIVVLRNSGKSRESAWTYWLNVGRCLPADFILVPQLLRWNEFGGGGYPASVVMDLYLIDVKGERLVARYHYDETQKALTENLLDLPKFMKRKGQWVSAAALATEGIQAGLTEIGL